MAARLEDDIRVVEELEEGEINDDEDDDDDIMCLGVEPKWVHPVLKVHLNEPSTLNLTRNSVNDNNGNRTFTYGRIHRNIRNDTAFRPGPYLNTGRTPKIFRHSSVCRPSRSDSFSQPLPYKARYSSETRNSRCSRPYSNYNKAKLSASSRSRLSDYSWKRQRLLSSIRKRSRSHRRSVLPYRHDSSYEELLAQYEDIKNKLRKYDDNASVHSVTSDDSIEIEELNKENLSSCKDGRIYLEDTDIKSQKVRSDKTRQSRLRETRVNGQSTSTVTEELPKDNEDHNMEQKEEEEEEEEAEEVLRSIALASAQKARQEKSTISSQIHSGNLQNAILGDNYEEVAMDLDSSASSPIREPQSSNTEADVDEDEDILRAMLLSSLTNKQLGKSSKPQDVSSSHSSVHHPSVPLYPQVLRKNSKLTAVKKIIIPPPPVHQPVVINLNDDSDSENEIQCLASEKASLNNIDDLLMKARQLSDLNALDNQQKMPASVLELPKCDVLEYQRLKAEIAKREQKKLNKKIDCHHDSSTDASVGGTESPIPIKENSNELMKLRSFEHLLQEQQESIGNDEAEMAKVKLQIENKASTLNTTELKITKLKEQLVAAVKVVGIHRQNLEKLEKKYKSLESNLALKKDEISKLEKECLASGKKISGNSYNLPHKLPATPEKQKPVIIGVSPGNRRKVVLSKSAKTLSVTIAKDNKLKTASTVLLEKAKLKKMEQEIAAKLEVLRWRASKASKLAKSAAQTGTSSPGGKSVKALMHSPILKRERKRSLRSETSSKKLESDEKNVTGLNFTVLPKVNNQPVKDTVKDFSFTEQQIAQAKEMQAHFINNFLETAQEDNAVFTFDFHSMFMSEIPKTGMKLPDCSYTTQNVQFKDPFQSYQSPLLHLKSFRFSPYFRTKANQCLTWPTYSHKLNPNKMLCRFDLTGTCNDDKCLWQHKKEYMMTGKEILCDIVSYSPSLAEYSSASVEACHEHIENYVDKLLNSNQDRMTQDELCVLLVGRVNESSSKAPPHFTTFDERLWHPNSQCEVDASNVTNTEREFQRRKYKDVQYIPDDYDPDVVIDENDVRYFNTNGCSGQDENFESTLLSDPKNTTLWIKFAYRKLNSVGCSQELCLDLALNVLSRGLEENQDNSEIWLHYLSLYSKREHCSDLINLCEQAIKFAPTYEIWWKYLQYSEGYKNKTSKCYDIIQFVVESTVEPNVKSHQILEILLYLCQLNCLAGRRSQAILVFEEALGRKTKRFSSTLVSVGDHLVSTDRCLAWLCYIHVLEFASLPSTLFNPASSGLGKLVCKDLFILPWKNGQPIRLPVGTLLKLFMEALSNSVKKGQPAKVNVQVCLPLYKNLIALELFRGRNASAVEVCEKLVKVAVLDEVWILLACVYFRIGSIDEVRKSLNIAVKSNDATPKLFCFAAMFELSQGNVVSARDWACSCIETFFDLDEEVSVVESEIMYCHLLGLPLPLNSRVPVLKPIATELLKQKSYMWLNYCIFLITQDRYMEVKETFENAILRITARDDLEITWLHYLQYTLCCITESTNKQQDFLTFANLVERCLSSVPCKVSVPGSVHKCWINYSFFNTVVDLYARSVDSEQQIKVYEKFLAMCPKNALLCIKLLNIYLNRSEYKKAWYLCQNQLENVPSCLHLWKVSLFLAHKEKSITEIRTLYIRATTVLPYSIFLWKNYLLFELSIGQSERAKRLLIDCQKFGVSLNEFAASIAGNQSSPNLQPSS